MDERRYAPFITAERSLPALTTETLEATLFCAYLRLTLPRIEYEGFFLHPARLPLARLGRGVEAACPEAFAEVPSAVPVCPTVPSSAFARMLRGIVISIQQKATSGTEMRPHAQRFLHQRSARTTLQARVVGRDGDHHNVMQPPIVSHPLQEHAPSSIGNALCQLAVPDHVTDLEVFIGN
jgi:hypothetical protein